MKVLLQERKDLQEHAPRNLERGVGVVCGIGGLAFLSLAGLGIVRSRGMDTGLGVFVLVLLILGGGLLHLSIRLITGRGRSRDGGLFAPWVLKVAAVLFAVATLALPIANREYIILSPEMLAAAVACWILARRRETPAKGPSEPLD